MIKYRSEVVCVSSFLHSYFLIC